MSDKQRILIADDSEMNRAILTEMLGEEYEILEAENGQQAIEMIEKNSGIDLLLLDIMMPVKDGFDVLTAMNQYHWIDELPVIMISAENATSFVERAYNLGAPPATLPWATLIRCGCLTAWAAQPTASCRTAAPF